MEASASGMPGGGLLTGLGDPPQACLPSVAGPGRAAEVLEGDRHLDGPYVFADVPLRPRARVPLQVPAVPQIRAGRVRVGDCPQGVDCEVEYLLACVGWVQQDDDRVVVVDIGISLGDLRHELTAALARHVQDGFPAGDEEVQVGLIVAEADARIGLGGRQ